MTKAPKEVQKKKFLFTKENLGYIFFKKDAHHEDV